ncbi:hypothetical protein ABT264_19655 [Streptomyces virginiae]
MKGNQRAQERRIWQRDVEEDIYVDWLERAGLAELLATLDV